MPTDAERLDFLGKQLKWGDCFMVQNMDAGDLYVRPWRYDNQSFNTLPAKTVYQTIREAIDGAMRGDPVGIAYASTSGAKS
jgi:hypothetical protein